MNKKMLLISIRPEYLKKIMDGSKTIELRKTKPKIKPGDLLIFYASSPSKALSGAALVKGIIEETPANMWKLYYEKIGIDLTSFNKYFSTYKKAYGIILGNVWEYDPISLDELRHIILDFSPPQSYRYLSINDFKLIKLSKKKKLKSRINENQKK